jgi:hypothetical protein
MKAKPASRGDQSGRACGCARARNLPLRKQSRSTARRVRRGCGMLAGDRAHMLYDGGVRPYVKWGKIEALLEF